jgi:hypothetical protein
MSRIVSTDGRFAWNGHRWKLVTDADHIPSPFNSDQAASFSENTYSTYPTESGEAFELSFLGESTPLLSSAAVPVAAVSATPSVAAVAVGTALAAGTIIIGATLGSKSDDPIVTFPGHHYTGPGNTLVGQTPVDSDDTISHIHDIAYDKAKSQSDVQAADDDAISDFIGDTIHTGNIHSAVGAAGLGIKRTIESVIGVQYPANLPVSISGKYGSTWQQKETISTCLSSQFRSISYCYLGAHYSTKPSIHLVHLEQ